jgi:hypothetical protein
MPPLIPHVCVSICGHSNHLKLSGSREQGLEVVHSPVLIGLGLVEKDSPHRQTPGPDLGATRLCEEHDIREYRASVQVIFDNPYSDPCVDKKKKEHSKLQI